MFAWPRCGATPSRTSKITCEEGELFEVDKARKPAISHSEKQRFYSELQGYAQAKGKGEKWVLAQYRARTKVWPRGLVPHPIEPTPGTLGWLHSRRIAWAKSKARAA